MRLTPVGRPRRCRGPVAAAAVLAAVLAPAHAGLRTVAYYAGWMQDHLPAAEVDFGALTHVVHFALVPNPDGTLDDATNVVTAGNAADVVARAHAAGTKALISVGGAGSADGFRGACSPANLPLFVANIVAVARSRGYDGVDLDWEPLEPTDAALCTSLVNGLRTALDACSPRPLLTAAVATQPGLVAALQHQFDQVNLMTYDLAGPWPGWATWFNSPLHDGGFRLPGTGAPAPSAGGMVDTFAAAGVAPEKLGVGIDFYGRVWSGGTGTSTGGASLPRQSWAGAPQMTSAAYHEIMTTFYQPQLRAWDAAAQAAWLGIDAAGSADDRFISYDDEAACRAKVGYAARRGLGGVMIWELGGGYRPDQPGGGRDPLLQAVKQAVRETLVMTSIRAGGGDVTVEFSSAIGQSYRVEWSADLLPGSWAGLAEVTAAGPVTRVTDPGGDSHPRRFYRVVEVRPAIP